MSDVGQDGSSMSEDDVDRGEGVETVGRELIDFFLYLLSDGEALKRYYNRGTRTEIIGGRPGLSPHAKKVLEEGSLREIEEHILAVGGSYAKPLMIVWPPM